MVSFYQLLEVEAFMFDYKIPQKYQNVDVLMQVKKKTTAAMRAASKEFIPDYIFRCANLRTGEIRDTEREVRHNAQYRFVTQGGDARAIYSDYIEELKILIIGTAKINARSITANPGPRYWETDTALIIFPDKSVYNFYRNELVPVWDIPSWWDHTCTITGERFSSLHEDIEKMFPRYCNVGSNSMVDITSQAYLFREFLCYKEPTVKKGLKQQKINEMVSISLPAISADSHPENGKEAFIQKVDEKTAVIRTVVFNDRTNNYEEAGRIYVSKNEILACRPALDGRWVNLSMKNAISNWDFNLNPFNPLDCKGTKLEYIVDVVQKAPPSYQVRVFQTLLTYPLVEQLCSLGMEEEMIELISHCAYGKFTDILNSMFGEIDYKQKGAAKALGLNKYQLKKIIQSIVFDLRNHHEERFGKQNSYGCRSYCSILRNIKRIFDPSAPMFSEYYSRNTNPEFVSLASLDNESFDKILKGFDRYYRDGYFAAYGWSRANFISAALKAIKENYSQEKMLKMIEPIIDIAIPEGSLNICQVYLDFLKMVVDLNATNEIRPDFNSMDQIYEKHDSILEVYNMKKDAIRTKEFVSAVASSKKWEFSDDDYAIIAPKLPSEVANEGMVLHHCVKSYISKICERQTNILFLRKKTELHTPFFTIEITNDNSVQQIHGFGNKNICEEPEIIPFVDKWIKKKNLHRTNFNKVR